jgi:hypothetical protein
MRIILHRETDPQPLGRGPELRPGGPGTLGSDMMGEQEAVVVDVRPFELHGLTYFDVSVAFPDRSVEQARLGPEGVPGGLQPGERVLATRVANMVVSLRRP